SNPKRPVHCTDKRLGEDSDSDGRASSQSQRSPHPETDRQALFFSRFTHKHGVRDLQVVVQPKHGVSDAQSCQYVVATLNQTEENKVFSVKACQWRDTSQ